MKRARDEEGAFSIGIIAGTKVHCPWQAKARESYKDGVDEKPSWDGDPLLRARIGGDLQGNGH